MKYHLSDRNHVVAVAAVTLAATVVLFAAARCTPQPAPAVVPQVTTAALTVPDGSLPGGVSATTAPLLLPVAAGQANTGQVSVGQVSVGSFVDGRWSAISTAMFDGLVSPPGGFLAVLDGVDWPGVDDTTLSTAAHLAEAVSLVEGHRVVWHAGAVVAMSTTAPDVDGVATVRMVTVDVAVIDETTNTAGDGAVGVWWFNHVVGVTDRDGEQVADRWFAHRFTPTSVDVSNLQLTSPDTARVLFGGLGTWTATTTGSAAVKASGLAR